MGDDPHIFEHCAACGARGPSVACTGTNVLSLLWRILCLCRRQAAMNITAIEAAERVERAHKHTHTSIHLTVRREVASGTEYELTNAPLALTFPTSSGVQAFEWQQAEFLGVRTRSRARACACPLSSYIHLHASSPRWEASEHTRTTTGLKVDEFAHSVDLVLRERFSFSLPLSFLSVSSQSLVSLPVTVCDSKCLSLLLHCSPSFISSNYRPPRMNPKQKKTLTRSTAFSSFLSPL